MINVEERKINYIKELEVGVNSYYSLKFKKKIQGKVKYYKSGAYHNNYIYEYDTKVCILRINISSQLYKSDEEQINYEFNTLKDLQSSEVTPIPLDIIYLNIGDSVTLVLVESFIYGELFNYKRDLYKVAKSLGKIHACKRVSNNYIECSNPAKMLYEDAWLRIKKLQDYGINNESLRLLMSYEKSLNYNMWQFKNHVVINNTDLNASNFIIDGEKCYIIDWECSRVSNFTWDLAHFIATTTTLWNKKSMYRLSDEEKFDFIKVYCETLEFNDVDFIYSSTLQLLKFIYFRCFAWAHEHYYININGKDENSMIKEYVNSDFLNSCLLEFK